VADRDATGGEDLVDMAQAERKSEVEPDGVADDLGREPMSGVAGGGGRRHPVRLPDPTLPQQAANLTVPSYQLKPRCLMRNRNKILRQAAPDQAPEAARLYQDHGDGESPEQHQMPSAKIR
jgi:hypothetical protein